jgi:hypothetical protein
MGSKTHRRTFVATTIISALVFGVPALAEDENSPALAAAMKNVPTTLAEGLQASEQAGKPISAKLRSRMASCSSRSTR